MNSKSANSQKISRKAFNGLWTALYADSPRAKSLSFISEESVDQTPAQTPVEYQPEPTVQADPELVSDILIQIDPEMDRYWYALGKAQAYHLYCHVRALAVNNKVDIHKLAASVVPGRWRKSQFYKLLSLETIASDQNPFYTGYDGRWLYYRSKPKMAARAKQMLLEKHDQEPHKGWDGVWDGRNLGNRESYISLFAKRPQFWELWLGDRKIAPVSRQTLAKLWHVDEMTTLRWDKAAGIGIQTNFGQSSDLRDERIPADRPDFKEATINGQHVGMWQRPNTRHPQKTYRQHPHKGQARKVRKSVNGVSETAQPAEKLAAAHPYRIQNFVEKVVCKRVQGTDRHAEYTVPAWQVYQDAVAKKPDAQTVDYVLLGKRHGAAVMIWQLMAPRPAQDMPNTSTGRFVRVK
ncbi:MAG: hypothetical protein CMJ42_18445 [Phyllobacteriaceae bacterium]|nr:hypothetical protein [Phyllobacteriaceae bacterium]